MSRLISPNRLGLLLALSFACLPAAAAQDAGPHQQHMHKRDERKEIEDLEEQWRLATVNGDIAAMDKLLSPDYVGISMTGQVNTKEQQLDRLRNRTLVLKSLELSDLKVKLVGSVAIVTGHTIVDGTNDGASVAGEYRYTRVYQRTPSGAWTITNYEVTRIPRPKAG
jgi:ketosteroid isomerase-like protein